MTKYKNKALQIKAICLYKYGKYDIFTISKHLNTVIVISYDFNESLTLKNGVIFINDKVKKEDDYFLEFTKLISKIYLEEKYKNISEDDIEDFALELVVGEKELKSFYELYKHYPNLSFFKNYFNIPEKIIEKELDKLNLKLIKE